MKATIDSAGRLVVPKPLWYSTLRASETCSAGSPRWGLVGGAAYDALIAMTAAHSGASLVSCDLRAALVYSRCGVAGELL
jgi:hypothetical protein